MGCPQVACSPEQHLALQGSQVQALPVSFLLSGSAGKRFMLSGTNLSLEPPACTDRSHCKSTLHTGHVPGATAGVVIQAVHPIR